MIKLVLFYTVCSCFFSLCYAENILILSNGREVALDSSRKLQAGAVGMIFEDPSDRDKIYKVIKNWGSNDKNNKIVKKEIDEIQQLMREQIPVLPFLSYGLSRGKYLAWIKKKRLDITLSQECRNISQDSKNIQGISSLRSLLTSIIQFNNEARFNSVSSNAYQVITDIKGDNIMRDSSGRWYIVDFELTDRNHKVTVRLGHDFCRGSLFCYEPCLHKKEKTKGGCCIL